MLEQFRVHPTIPATDLDRARRFYADRLGLTPQRELPGGLEYECAGGTRFMLTRASGAASPSRSAASCSRSMTHRASRP